MKKFLALLLALTMVLSMAACGTNETKSTDPASDATTDVAGETAQGTYTYNTYMNALGTNWNPHTWENSADETILTYMDLALVDATVKDSTTGEYQWVWVGATNIEDVTAEHQDDLVKYGATETDATEGYVYEISLRENAKWQDGTPINADTYVYSMKQLLDPDMKNYRANNYYTGDSAVAGGYTYYYSKTEGMYVAWNTEYDSIEDAIADGKELCINAWEFYGAEGYVDADGNECPEYVPITDETVYGEDVGDAFSGADLYAGYGEYFATDYADYLCYFSGNENYNPDMSYDDTVGLYKVDDYTIRYVCQNAYGYYYFLTSCTSNWIVHEELYEACKNVDATTGLISSTYGTSVDTTMSCGPYKITSLEDNKQMVLEQNENYFEFTQNADGTLTSISEFEVDGQQVEQYQTQKIIINVMTDDAAKLAFLSGELDDWSLSADDARTYSTSEQLYKADETYTMRLFFNCDLENLKVMDENETNINGVVMSNENFRKAFSLAIDRDEFVTATAGYKPAYFLLNYLYYYDVYNDPTSIYRNSDPAKQAVLNLYDVEYGEGTPYAGIDDAYDAINGYNLTEAQNLMKTACEELVAEGLYTEGDPITIKMAWSAGSADAAAQQQVALLNQYINAAASGSGFGTITLDYVDNLSTRYDDVINGLYAIGWGAWGGAAFYPFNCMKMYMDPDYTKIHEGGCWDPTSEELTLTVEGEEVTMTWQAWSQSLSGAGVYTNADMDTKVQILADLEQNFLLKYYCIPICTTTACSMLSYKVNYYTEDYNIMYGYGGTRLMSYNYSDAEWADYVASEGGSVGY